MTSRYEGFLTFPNNKNPNLITTHCLLHREALMAKSSYGGEISNVLKTVTINHIKTRPVKCRLFEKYRYRAHYFVISYRNTMAVEKKNMNVY